jgi:hypothetical protein
MRLTRCCACCCTARRTGRRDAEERGETAGAVLFFISSLRITVRFLPPSKLQRQRAARGSRRRRRGSGSFSTLPVQKSCGCPWLGARCRAKGAPGIRSTCRAGSKRSTLGEQGTIADALAKELGAVALRLKLA